MELNVRISFDMDKLLDDFNDEYEYLYNSTDDYEVMDNQSVWSQMFDNKMKDELFKRVLAKFNHKRGELCMSDRECAAFYVAYNRNLKYVKVVTL